VNASDDIRYPIGKWVRQASADADACATWIQQIAATPAAVADAVRGLTDQQLDTPHRPDGWTPRQIVHHLADSHMNAYIRFKLGTTEEHPTIKPYNEKTWAETIDGRTAPVAWSLPILEGMHHRWVQFLRSMDGKAFARMVEHPERGPMSLSDLLQLYAWHGRHHTAQITALRQRMGW
jgi:uncharacterized damage-inducible protein DinB